MSIRTKITLGVLAAVLASSFLTLILNVGMFRERTRKIFTRELMDTAGLVSQLPEVREGLRDSPYNGAVQSLVQRLLAASGSVDQIIVCDMNRIRYSHANPEFIGQIQEGDDVKDVLYQARRYASPVNSTLDDATGGYMRAYAPVFDGQEQLGFVVAGALRERVENETGHLTLSAIVFGLAGLAAGLVGSFIVAQYVAKNLHGHEPGEILEVFNRHGSLIEAMHEGVVAINNRGRISLINASARKMLGLGDRQLEGQAIDNVMPNTRLPSVVSAGQSEFGGELRLNGRVFIANMVPIREREQVVGAVETLQDRTQVIRMAEELTGIRQLVEALRASSHEFSNKLHVILGLLELGEYDQAKGYVQTTQARHGQLHTQLLRTFKEPMIAGLMLGKFSVARERGIGIAVSPGSGIETRPSPELAHTLVLVLGNLVDNALDATRDNPDRDGRILVDIREHGGRLNLLVEDNGGGVSPENLEAIFQKGFSTKGEGRGTGLFLVRQELVVHGGSIEVASGGGLTLFTARLPINGNGSNPGT